MTRRALVKVQIARRELGLSGDDYRMVLKRLTGKDSATRCSDAELGLVLDGLKAIQAGATLSVRVWDDDEVAWALECRGMGDSVADIAQAAGCSAAEVVANIGGEQMTPRQREVVSLYTSGCSFAEIDTARGQTSGRPGSAAGAMITYLRRAGWPIPYRHNWRRFT
jgi:Protein of unknown function (DUF1018).